jgi:hypothetical protein
VGDDGSFFVLDSVKRRVAHFDPTGSYLGSLGRFPKGRWTPRDLVVHDGTLVALRAHSRSAAADTSIVTAEDLSNTTVVSVEGDPAIVYTLIAGTDPVAGHLHGYAEL